MLKEIIKMASDLDAKGFTEEADNLDAIIKKVADSMSVFQYRRLENEFLRAAEYIQGSDKETIIQILSTLREVVETIGASLTIDVPGHDSSVNLLEGVDAIDAGVKEGDSPEDTVYFLKLYALYLKSQYKPEAALAEIKMNYDVDLENPYNNL
jgi:hypothetical protein